MNQSGSKRVEVISLWPPGCSEYNGRDRRQRRDRADGEEIFVFVDLGPEFFRRNIEAENDPRRSGFLKGKGDAAGSRNRRIEQVGSDWISLLLAHQRQGCRFEGRLAQHLLDCAVETLLGGELFVRVRTAELGEMRTTQNVRAL